MQIAQSVYSILIRNVRTSLQVFFTYVAIYHKMYGNDDRLSSSTLCKCFHLLSGIGSGFSYKLRGPINSSFKVTLSEIGVQHDS